MEVWVLVPCSLAGALFLPLGERIILFFRILVFVLLAWLFRGCWARNRRPDSPILVSLMVPRLNALIFCLFWTKPCELVEV